METGSTHGIRSFCSTQWSLRGDAIESIIKKYDALNKLPMSVSTPGDVKGRIIGVQTQMSLYSTLFGMLLSENFR
jgi:hypothetical protein